jgi:flagellar basal-body rod protein FlgG
MPEVSTSIDTRPGSIKLTSEALDLAIEGEGFFEVAMPDGPAYTRHGRFHLDARGRLVTEAGAAVMGRSGELQLTGTQPSIDRQGVVTDAGKTVGQLKAVTFPAGTSLVRLGDGLYRPSSAGVVPQESKDPVRQGYVENSNVASMTEMVRLVETMRHFESAQKVIQGYDEMLEKSLRKLGEF